MYRSCLFTKQGDDQDTEGGADDRNGMGASASRQRSLSFDAFQEYSGDEVRRINERYYLPR